MATAAASDPSRNLIDLETADNPNSIAESGSNNNNASATDTVDTRNATGTLDEDTSSIEALNWCEFDEDEMASAKAPEIISSKPEVDEENMDTVEQEILSTGPPLSTSLLQSIDSQMSEDDKVTNIENWASEVISATTEEGLINDLETVIDESGVVSTSTSSTTVYQRVPETEEKLETISKGSRKRPHKSNAMAMSTMSSLSSAESKGDPLSNAPVLDDGPIWGKGSKRYKFQENRRFNQKLTFGVLLSVVMAIGLGLGNLVAYNECEAEYKATPSPTTAPPVSSSSPDDNLKPGEEPSLTSVAPEDNANEDNVKHQDISEDIKFPVVDEEIKASDGSVPAPPEPHDNNKHEPTKNDEKKEDLLSDKISKPINEKPFVDPTYASHAEALASVVKSLDQLSRKIDQFQNTTRQLGGIVMLKEEVMKELRSKTGSDNKKAKDDDNSQPIFEEEVHPDVADDEIDITELAEDKLVEDLIEAIDGHEPEDEFEMGEDDGIKSIDDEETQYMKQLIDKYYFAPLKKMKEEFIEQERERLNEERLKYEEEEDYEKFMKVGDYDEEDKKALLARYREFQKQYEAQNKLDYSSSETETPQKVQDTEEIVRVDSDEDTHVISEEMGNIQQIVEKEQVNDIKQEEKLTPPEDPTPLVNNILEKQSKKDSKKRQEKERKEKPNQELGDSDKKEKSKKEFKNKYNKREHNKSEQPLTEKDNYKQSNKYNRQEKQKRDSSPERDIKKKKETENTSGNEKRKKRQEKRQKYIDERFYDESEVNHEWTNYQNDWSDHRAKLREQNRNDVYSDSSSHLVKKNKNWQLDRDRAREKFRNKNKSDSD